jgi:hypothetical protein
MYFDIIEDVTYKECIENAKYAFERMQEIDSELQELYEKERYWEDAMADGEPEAQERFCEVSEERRCLEDAADSADRNYDFWMVQAKAAKNREMSEPPMTPAEWHNKEIDDVIEMMSEEIKEK